MSLLRQNEQGVGRSLSRLRTQAPLLSSWSLGSAVSSPAQLPKVPTAEHPKLNLRRRRIRSDAKRLAVHS